jgi:hypothetical protein
MSTLSAVLQGVDRGAGIGLNMYQALNAESRAKRQEVFQKDRAARQDMETDRTHDRQVGRDGVLDGQWNDSFKREGERNQVADDHWEQNLSFLQAQHRDTNEVQRGTLALGERKQTGLEEELAYDKSEVVRTRNEANSKLLFNNTFIDEKGRDITDPAVYAGRVNQNPEALKSVIDTAVASGLITKERAAGYTGAQLVPTKNGLVLRVAGVDGTGKPIAPGGAPLTAMGTDSPDDLPVELNISQLRGMTDPTAREAQRSAALYDDQVDASNTSLSEAELGVTEEMGRSVAGAQAKSDEIANEIAGIEAQIAAAGTRTTSTNPRAVARNGSAKLQEDLAKAEQSFAAQGETLSNLTARMNEVPGDFQGRRDENQAYLSGQRDLYGNKYASETLVQSIENKTSIPASNAAADKAYTSMVDKFVSSIPKPKKGEPPLKMSTAQTRAMLTMIPVETQRKIGADPEYASLFYNTAEFMQRTGFNGNPIYLMEAEQAGANREAYVEYVTAEQNAGKPKLQVHEEAISVAKEKQANPGRSLGEIAGGRLIP